MLLKFVTSAAELREHAKCVVPPRSTSRDQGFILLPSAGCFYYFPFVGADGARFAFIGRPANSGPQQQLRPANSQSDYVSMFSPESQVPADVLKILKRLAPNVATPTATAAATKERQEMEQAHIERMKTAHEPTQQYTQEQIEQRRKELAEQAETRVKFQWTKQAHDMQHHTTYAPLIPGSTVMIGADVTLFVVDDPQCLLASRNKLKISGMFRSAIR